MKKLQLFLLPYAGGSSFAFMKMLRMIDSRIETIPIEYAGRGIRSNIGFIADYLLFLSDVSNEIEKKRNNNLPFALFGYSMGSIVAYEISSRKLLKTEACYHFFCAEDSPKEESMSRKLGNLNKEKFKNSILEFGGIDSRIEARKEIFDKQLDIIKHDFDVLKQYTFKGRKISSDASILYGSLDKTYTNIEGWNEIIEGETERAAFSGSHFFIHKNLREVAELINLKLKRFL